MVIKSFLVEGIRWESVTEAENKRRKWQNLVKTLKKVRGYWSPVIVRLHPAINHVTKDSFRIFNFPIPALPMNQNRVVVNVTWFENIYKPCSSENISYLISFILKIIIYYFKNTQICKFCINKFLNF